jgi:diguanylate cyclase (GGDEF)-like protein
VPTGDWSTQQLAEFLAAVSSSDDADTAVERAVERAAEAVEAEVGAMIRQGTVVCSIGFAPHAVPEEELRRVASSSGEDLYVSGIGLCPVLAVPLDDGASSWLVLARAGDGFSREEAGLVRGMVRVLSLTLRTLGVLDTERSLRQESEKQGVELVERQSLMERLFQIQRLISGRAPLQVVFDAIVDGAASLFSDDVVGLRLVDEDDPTYANLVASVGVDDETLAVTRRTPVGTGVGGRAIAEGRLVVADHYSSFPAPLQAFVDDSVNSAVATPVTRDGDVVGSLVVASHRAGRAYGQREQEMLLALAEHVSLALNDASARQAIDTALGDAVHQATHDALTGLPNRALVLDRLEHALAQTNRRNKGLAVLFLDLDHFKTVNDSLGHGIGDEVLVTVAGRLTREARAADTIGRLAGDEFVVICEDVGLDEALGLAQRLADAVAEPTTMFGRETVLTASIGIAHTNRGGQADEMLRDADVAMYRAKERGRSRIEVFDHAMRTRILERIETEQALRRAIGSGDLRVHYQPIFSLATGRPVSIEALVRWQLADGRLVPPDEFIPLAESTGLIVPLGAWVLTRACSDLAAWRHDHTTLANLQVAVNLSSRQFADDGLGGIVAEALAGSGLPKSALAFEITESVLMDDAENTVETLKALKALGVRLMVDDFGTGYSSLSYLKRFPVDTLKIDRSFVSGLDRGDEDTAIVTAVISLAKALGLKVVAEGVETAAQLEVLQRLGCQLAQGYLLGRPMPAPQIVATLIDAMAAVDTRARRARRSSPETLPILN